MARQRLRWLPWVLGFVVLSALYYGGRSNQNVADTQAPTHVPIQSKEGVAPSPSSPSSPKQVIERTMYVTASSLNVRSTPDPAATVLLKAGKGTAVLAVGLQGEWVEVKLSNGSTGWMNSTYLSEAPALQLKQDVVTPPKKAEPPPRPAIDRNAIVSALIAESQASYPGNCPCPENRMRNGRRCGGNSAWSKGGGYSPLCYSSDVTDAMIKTYLSRE
jgi:hypothetical protein